MNQNKIIKVIKIKAIGIFIKLNAMNLWEYQSHPALIRARAEKRNALT